MKLHTFVNKYLCHYVNFVQISHIGLPTNVSHMSHAATPEEAEKLIQQLMASGPASSSLPPPLLPQKSPGNYFH